MYAFAISFCTCAFGSATLVIARDKPINGHWVRTYMNLANELRQNNNKLGLMKSQNKFGERNVHCLAQFGLEAMEYGSIFG